MYFEYLSTRHTQVKTQMFVQLDFVNRKQHILLK